MGAGMGYIMRYIPSSFASVTRANIGVCFPHLSAEEQDALANQSMVETMIQSLEILRAWGKPANDSAAEVIEEEGLELLLDYEAQEKGFIILVPHIGNWEILIYRMARDHEPTVIYQPPKEPALDEFILNARQKNPSIKLVPTNHRGVAQLLKTVKKGGMVGILPDQNPDARDAPFAPFFGHPAQTVGLVNTLVQRTGCNVVMGYVVRIKGGYKLIFSKPADPAIGDEDEAIGLAALNNSVQAVVERFPEQYQWEYKRFKRQPPGYPKIY